MKIAVYSSKPYETPFLSEANAGPSHDLVYFDARLSPATTDLARGCPAVSIFVGDDASAPVLRALHEGGTRLLALRSAGFNHVDIAEADRLGLMVLRVPAYSPHAVAEHAVGLMMTLNRKFHRAFNRVREQNFALDGLMGFDMHGKTAGVIGTGKIGEVVCRILTGFGCRVLASDPVQNPACASLGAEYVALADLYARCDIITLHCPLTPQTKHLINAAALAAMRPGVMLINTSRGAVIDTRALIAALKRGHAGSVGLDVYEEEGDLFFKDLSGEVIQDDVFVRLLTFPNVLITAHQGFFTREAMTAIAETTINNVTDFERGTCQESNRVGVGLISPTPAARCPNAEPRRERPEAPSASVPLLLQHLHGDPAHFLEDADAPADRPPIVEVHLQGPPHCDPAGDHQALAEDSLKGMGRGRGQQFAGGNAAAKERRPDEQTGSGVTHQASKLEPAKLRAIKEMTPDGPLHA